MRLFKLTLAGPLQSWGDHARWDNRDTASAPTKSAIIGMIGSCMGIPRGDPKLRMLSDKLHMAVRIDAAGHVITDYHTVQGTGGIMLNAKGKPRGGGSTIITPRQYLQDARFAVYIWGDDGLLNEAYNAFLHPKWAPYLGRKSCTPSIPIVPQWIEAPCIDDAISSLTPEEQQLGKHARIVQIEVLPEDNIRPDENIIERRDNVVRADINDYNPRYIRVSRVKGAFK